MGDIIAWLIDFQRKHIEHNAFGTGLAFRELEWCIHYERCILDRDVIDSEFMWCLLDPYRKHKHERVSNIYRYIQSQVDVMYSNKSQV